MSCTTNQSTATVNFNLDTFSGSPFDISLLEETQSTDNTCTLTAVRGKIQLDLTSFTTGGTATLYFNVTSQTDGSSNSPPVTADGLFHAALSATVGIVNTSSYYANTTPTFSASNDCVAADKKLGWNLVDQTSSVQPFFSYNV